MDIGTSNEKQRIIKSIRDSCFQYEDFIPLIVRNESDAVYFAKNIKECILPIFFISNVSGHNLNLLKKFLNILPLEKNITNDSERTEFIVKDKFIKADKIVLTGWVYRGRIRKHQKLYLGPLNNKEFM